MAGTVECSATSLLSTATSLGGRFVRGQSVESELDSFGTWPKSADPPLSNSVNHFAFRVETFEDVRELNAKLEKIDGIKIGPMSHGNTLSIYFNDPEGNGIEVFWDTPWHVAQPQGKGWDISMNEAEALKWVESEFKDAARFGPKEGYQAERRTELGKL